MSLQFYGWEVTYDYPLGLELRANQKPQNQRVYTMYHGTTAGSARSIITTGFVPSTKGMLGPGVYVSRDKKKAERYPLQENPSDRVVLELQVCVGRVKRIDKDNHPMQYTWHSQGYDTAWVPPNCGMTAVKSGLEEDCIFDPKRITVLGIAMAPKSAKNELEQLVANSPSSGGPVACSLCNRKEDETSPHIKQKCWGCGKNICSLMTKHFCFVSN